MSTNESSTDESFSPSDWSWVGPWLLFMAAIAAFFSTNRGPVMTAVLGLSIVGAGYLCFLDQRAREKREKRHG